jgi:hypothetical protein
LPAKPERTTSRVPDSSTVVEEDTIMKTLALLSALALAGPAFAVSIHTTVTPANIKKQTSPPLAVSVSEADRLKQFEVVVKGKAGEEARFLQDAILTVVKGGRTIVTCPVARVERKGDVVFSFTISPDHLEGSTFRVAYIAHIKMKDERGREKWIGMPSGNFLTFPLADFAKVGKEK